MKFLDKVKNMFTEEVVEEEKEKNDVKVEQIIPQKKNEIKIEDFSKIKHEEIKEEKKPVFFTDDDFSDLDNYLKQDIPKRSEVKNKVENKLENKVESKEEIKLYSKGDNPLKSANDYLEKYNEENIKTKEPYQGNASSEKTTPKFKPTPIISPVYGILDKNYHKEDIVNKNDKEYKAVDGLSVDSIRKKAYGTLEDELENTLFGSNSILFNDKEKDKKNEHDFFDEMEEETTPTDDNLRDLENITMDIGKELDTLLNKDKDNKKSLEDNSFDDEDDLFNLIDTMYDGDEKNDH